MGNELKDVFIMTIYIPKHEDITGADLTGSSPSKNRTYTLAYDNAIEAGFVINVAGQMLQQSVDFTLSSDVITFINNIWDNQNITLDYNVGTNVTSTTGYTTTKKIVKYVSGLGVTVENENLGTGDNAEDSYDLANGNVIADTYTLKCAASGSNDLTELTKTTHYTMNKASGLILLTSAGVTALGTNILYISYTHSPKMPDETYETYIGPASIEVDKITGNYWGPVKETVETQDGRDDNPYPSTDEPYVNNYNEPDFIQLKYKGVQDITSIVFIEGGSERTVDSSNYRFNDNGFITLIQDYLPLGYLNVKITYDHGYDETPELVCELASLLAGIRAYVNISGGSYDDATSFTLDKKSVTIGEAWVNIREVISQAQKRVDQIKNQLGPKMNVC